MRTFVAGLSLLCLLVMQACSPSIELAQVKPGEDTSMAIGELYVHLDVDSEYGEWASESLYSMFRKNEYVEIAESKDDVPRLYVECVILPVELKEYEDSTNVVGLIEVGKKYVVKKKVVAEYEYRLESEGLNVTFNDNWIFESGPLKEKVEKKSKSKSGYEDARSQSIDDLSLISELLGRVADSVQDSIFPRHENIVLRLKKGSKEILRANELAYDGRLNEAIIVFKRLERRDNLKESDRSALYFNIGVIYEKKRDYQNAVKSYKEAYSVGGDAEALAAIDRLMGDR